MNDNNSSDPDLVNESDRGVFIVAAAYIEDVLDEVLKQKIAEIKPSKGFVKNLFDLSGPLSSFSSKIAICYAFGLISKATYEDLSILRKLRNKAAHCHSEIDIDNQDTVNQILSLRCVKVASERVAANKMKRYDIKLKKTNQNTEKIKNTGLTDKEYSTLTARIRGFVKYHKSIFCIGIQLLTHQIKIEASDGTIKFQGMKSIRQKLIIKLLHALLRIKEKNI